MDRHRSDMEKRYGRNIRVSDIPQIVTATGAALIAAERLGAQSTSK